MKWQTRFILRSFLPLLPFQYRLRAFKRRISPFNADNASGVLEFALTMIRLLQSNGMRLENRTALELGTGWEPLVPLLLRCAGCAKVITVDLHRLLDIHSCRRIVSFLREHHRRIAGSVAVAPAGIDSFLAGLPTDDCDGFLSAAGIDYRAPCDARALPFADGSVDCIVSNNVLEHIPPEIIVPIFREFHRVLHPQGRMAHTIDNADHWSYTDPSISRVNFLQYDDARWERTRKNPIDYQNRLRHYEYLQMLSGAGFSLVHDASEVDGEMMGDLQRLQPGSRYRDVPHEKLAVALSRIIAGKEPQ